MSIASVYVKCRCLVRNLVRAGAWILISRGVIREAPLPLETIPTPSFPEPVSEASSQSVAQAELHLAEDGEVGGWEVALVELIGAGPAQGRDLERPWLG